MAPRPARALDRLRAQINALYPLRGKSADGWIGDTAHAARRSDHNPNAAGVVCAMDFTHDPAGGLDSYVLADMLRLLGDPRLKYIISNGRIASADKEWTWRVYRGANRHDHHVHVSVSAAARLYDDGSDWRLTPKPSPSSATADTPLLSLGSKGEAVKRLQALLAKTGIKIAADGDFGSKTERAVKAFQKRHGLLPDGWCGGKTWAALLA